MKNLFKSICPKSGMFLMILLLFTTILSPVYAQEQTDMSSGHEMLEEVYAKEESSGSTAIAIMSTTDMHGKCWDTNILTDSAVNNSFLKVATAVKAARETYGANTVLIDNGDLYQGTPISTYNILSENGVNNPMAMSLRYISYDASVLGNHEFNYPWQTMSSIYEYLQSQSDTNGTSVPVVSANIYREDGTNAFTPYITKDFDVDGQSFTVGILGLENTDCTRFDVSENYPGLIFAHPDNAEKSIAWEIERYVPQMKEAGCDFIIVSYHSGIGDTSGNLEFGQNTENQIARMVANTTGIDLVIAGHDHTIYDNKTINNKDGVAVPVVNGAGSQLTNTVFNVTYDDMASTFDIEMESNANIDLSSISNDEALKALLQLAVNKATDYVNTGYGTIKEGNWSTSTKYRLEQTDTIDVINRAQIWSAGREGIPVDVSATTDIISNSYVIQPGSITLKDIYKLYKYDNYLYVVELSGAELKAWMEGVADFYSGTQNSDGTITYEVKSNYTTALFYGLSFKYDLAQASGSRVTDLKLADGTHISDESKINVAVNNYVIGQAPFTRTGKTISDAIWSSQEELGDEGGLVTQMIANFVEYYTKKEGGVSPAASDWSLDYNVEADDTVRIPLFETTDIHGYLIDTSGTTQFRLAYLANIIHQARTSGEVMLLDGGDIFQGTLVSNMLDGESMSAIFDVMEYDAAALGNHEFDWGVDAVIDNDATLLGYDFTAPDDVANTVSGDGNTPVLASNLYYKGTNNRVTFTKDYIITEKEGKKIGVIGYVEDYSVDIMTSRFEAYEVHDDPKIVNSIAKTLIDSGQADAIVVVGHIDPLELVGSLDSEYIDIVLGGHSHTARAGVAANGITYLQGNCKGQGYAYAEIVFYDDGSVAIENPEYISITSDRSKLYEENSAEFDQEVYRISKIALAIVEPILTETIGTITTEIRKDVYLKGPNGETTRTHTAGNWITDLMNRSTGTDIAITNSGGIRTNFLFEEGETSREITVGDLYTMQPFGNTVPVFEVTAAQLWDIMSYLANDEKENMQMNGAVVSYYYDKEDDMNVLYKVVMDDGTVLDALDTKTTYLVSTNQYIAGLVEGPFAGLEGADNGSVDAELFMAELYDESDANNGMLYVDTTPRMIEISPPFKATDEDTGIIVEAEAGVVETGSGLVVEELFSGIIYDSIKKQIIARLNEDIEKYVLYDIKLSQNGEEIQPNGTLKISVPLPVGFTTDTKRLKIYHNHGGTLTELEFQLINDYLVFEVDTLSEFAIVQLSAGSNGGSAGQEGQDGKNGQDGKKAETSSAKKTLTTNSVKTEDEAQIFVFFVVLVCAVGICGVVLFKKRKDKA